MAAAAAAMMTTTTSLADLSAWFWDSDFWMRHNITWDDLELPRRPNEPDQPLYAQFSDLWMAFPGAVVVFVLRLLLERFLFRPLGIYLGLKAKRYAPAPHNPVLEHWFRTSGKKKKSSSEMDALSEQLGMSVRSVERWIRRRRMQNVKSKLEKFTETSYRLLAYGLLVIYALCVLWHKSYFWDIKNCWVRYPLHPVENDIWWYYMFELSFYFALCVSQFSDVKRKDFWEMFLHHLTTISLLGFSWTIQGMRVGSLIIFIHDWSDVFLESAKLFNYLKYQTACDLCFGGLTLSWVVTRLGFLPTWIVYSAMVEAPQLVELFPAYQWMEALVLVLLVLHIFWSYFIFKICYMAIYSGKTERDSRSDTSDLSLSDEDEHQRNQVKKDT